MGVYAKVTLKAPKFVEYMKELGVEFSTKDDIFKESSTITLPSGADACIFDEDAWGYTLYGPQEMGLPRNLGGIGEGKSVVSWIISHLVDVGELSDDEYNEECEFFDDEFEDSDKGMAFCQEIKDIIEKQYPGKKKWDDIGKLDDLIEEAEILYLSYWGGTDFDYSYAIVKDGEMSHWQGNGYDDEMYEDWFWKNLDGFITLIKENVSATTFKRKNGKWAKK